MELIVVEARWRAAAQEAAYLLCLLREAGSIASSGPRVVLPEAASCHFLSLVPRIEDFVRSAGLSIPTGR